MANIRRHYPAVMAMAIACLLTTACTNTALQEEHQHLASLKELSTGNTAVCNDVVDTSQTQYIIGYGSLMQEESRKRTAPNAGDALAIELQGFRRGWFAKGSDTGFSTTFLGAVTDKTSHFNAVMFTVSAPELAAMDKREAGYCRSPVAAERIRTAQEDTELPPGQYWIYLNSSASIALPGKDKPVVQSYVDIFLSGCLEQEEQPQLSGFAQRCISTTTDWSAHWVNDRLYPRRPFIHQPKAGQIDYLLKNTLPELFRQIVVE